MTRRHLAGIASALLLTWTATAAAPATAATPAAAEVPATAPAFGTIDGGGQHREHERLTRAALACADGERSGGDCFEPRTVAQLAGHGKGFSAVGAPDSDEISDPRAHCDGADFLEGSYPRTRGQASDALTACVDHLRARLREGVDSAAGLLDEDGGIAGGEVALGSDCQFFHGDEQRAKCATLEGFGRILHGVQDFYSHSNWADEADPARPIGDDNPPGLNRPGPSPLLDLRAPAAVVPETLATGCFVPRDQVPGVGACQDRITHAALNKDNGLIDPRTGAATDPSTPRGMVRENFAKAVAGAIAESRRQWRDFRAELVARHGRAGADAMVCALTRDDPAESCRVRAGGLTAAGITVLVLSLLVVAGAGTWLFLRARRRR